jgi:uncharacterized protein YbjT (DUF2867 family)
MKTAIIIGATGLTGTQLVDLLINDTRFNKILVFGRRSIEIQNQKIEEHIIDFDHPEYWKDLVQGDVLFSALGTTLKAVGSQDAQYRIDYTYQYQFAVAAASNNVATYVLVSSAAANPDSVNFYMRMKGELERDIKKLPFKHIQIIQPGPLDGNRKEYRKMERLSLKVIKYFNKMNMLVKYRPIHVRIVAQKMIAVSFSTATEPQTYTLEQVFEL